ncbi:hypothetical protein BpHYR1_041738 [Brachionus plicatilis]|uniref:Uncharacterized protein n=1 Tax=Brachionus plicatilis TaxID=10195 RepID=A0A3M7REK0_BRAPC|nr:hypothetical protein BpHYR1_041738 [Brachionus plicatilis]
MKEKYSHAYLNERNNFAMPITCVTYFTLYVSKKTSAVLMVCLSNLEHAHECSKACSIAHPNALKQKICSIAALEQRHNIAVYFVWKRSERKKKR